MEEIKSRNELIRYFEHCGFKKGAEIGVNYGLFSHYMLKTIPNLSLLSIDPWFTDKPDAKKARRTAYKTLTPYKNCQIIEKTSMMAACDVPDKSLDFVYIDGDHSFDAVMCDLIEWTKRVKPGGIVSGHDYLKKYHGLRRVVDVYTRFHNIKFYLTEPQRRGADKYISFYFEKK